MTEDQIQRAIEDVVLRQRSSDIEGEHFRITFMSLSPFMWLVSLTKHNVNSTGDLVSTVDAKLTTDPIVLMALAREFVDRVEGPIAHERSSPPDYNPAQAIHMELLSAQELPGL